MGSTRRLVLEHRVTRVVRQWVIRAWVEGNPDYGGVLEPAEAQSIVGEAMLQTRERYAVLIAREVIDSCPAVNSVEVCDEYGQGVCMHRDWP